MSAYSDRLRLAITTRQREGLHRPQIDESQIALVCRALADHTLIQDAMKYAPDDGPWPQATSIGRFFHHLADEFFDASHRSLPISEADYYRTTQPTAPVSDVAASEEGSA